MARIKCGYDWCFGKDSCKRKRECACRCEELKAVNAYLHDACVGACQEDPSVDNVPDGQEWMCSSYDPEFLFNHYKIGSCGYDPLDTVEGELYQDAEEKEANTARFQNQVIVGLAFLLFMLLSGYLYYKIK